ncbi:MAG: polyprenyl synthetase family protein [bacterium]
MSLDLKSYLAERKTRVEAALFACLPTAETRPVELSDAMRHAVVSGGKRLRPILCLASAEAAGGKAENAIHVACAVELLHTYTLVHDDLPCMDNDTLRRGQPTVWAKYSEAMAVLVGDALQTLAFETLAHTPSSPSAVSLLVSELAQAAGASGVIAGQVEDIQFAGAPTRDIINYVFQHKTADLFRAAVRLGAIAGGASDASLQHLSIYGNNLGIAFQIIDDLLDARQANADNKPELTCLAIMSEQEARAFAKQTTATACDVLKNLPGETEPLSALANELLSRVL